jgi:hypothetical protein
MEFSEVEELVNQFCTSSFTVLDTISGGEELFSHWYVRDLGVYEVALCERKGEVVFCMVRSDEDFTVFRKKGDGFVEERPRVSNEVVYEKDFSPLHWKYSAINHVLPSWQRCVYDFLLGK